MAQLRDERRGVLPAGPVIVTPAHDCRRRLEARQRVADGARQRIAGPQRRHRRASTAMLAGCTLRWKRSSTGRVICTAISSNASRSRASSEYGSSASRTATRRGDCRDARSPARRWGTPGAARAPRRARARAPARDSRRTSSRRRAAPPARPPAPAQLGAHDLRELSDHAVGRRRRRPPPSRRGPAARRTRALRAPRRTARRTRRSSCADRR